MSKTGKVKSWKKGYGFAEMKDGKLVFIHTDAIDGGRLRVGLPIKFDIEEVEGHDGKVKGINVTGEAVLAKGAKLSDEEVEADKKRYEEIKAARDAENQKEYDPVFKVVSKLSRRGKLALIDRLTAELELKDCVTYKNADDKRQDPTTRSKARYTKGEFIAFYGKRDGEKMWNAAGRLTKVCLSPLHP
ncbi:hypothetical protein DIPPA_12052 [Diplonema papillatum]|nr:hypothetical protein DIPPA_12052 [Diplonema papillatum]